MLTVVAAAILQDDIVYTLPPPARHHNIIRMMVEEKGLPPPIKGEQGFVLSDGRFAMRKSAARVALKAGQCKEPMSPPWLFSEDLW